MTPDLRDLFQREPLSRCRAVYRFGDEQDGDCFDEEDYRVWASADLYAERRAFLLANRTSDALTDRAVRREDFIVDLATGPGLGLIPALKAKSPGLRCVASDANDAVLRWHAEHAGARFAPIDFVQCSALNLPFRDGSVGAYGSFIGVSSVRSGIDGQRRALSEIRRTLRTGGRLYAVENDWSDVPRILALFERNGRRPWDCFLQERRSWPELLREAGFRILSQELFERRNLTAADNDLGEMAAASHVEIGLDFYAFIAERIG